jgi:hypothetical protein
MADHAPLPCFFGSRLFGHDSETPDLWDCHLVGIELGIAFSPNTLGVFYTVATFDDRDNWGNRYRDSYPCIDCGGTNTFGGAEITSYDKSDNF